MRLGQEINILTAAFLIASSAVLFAMQANARTVFLEVYHSKQANQRQVSGDVDTLVENGFVSIEFGTRSKIAADALISSLEATLKAASERDLRLNWKIEDFIAEMKTIDILFDLVPKQHGFGPLAEKATEVSSTQFHNHPGRKLIRWPVWPSKQIPIRSEIVKNLNRELVNIGILAHEMLSIFGYEDRGYSASTEIIRQGLLGDLPVVSGPGSIFRLAKDAGGASIVGGGGNDLSFSLKLLIRTFADQLKSNRIAQFEDHTTNTLARTLEKSFAELKPVTQHKVIQALNSVWIEDPIPNADMRTVLEITHVAQSDQFVIRLRDMQRIETALATQPSILDAFCIHSAQAIIAAIVAKDALP